MPMNFETDEVDVMVIDPNINVVYVFFLSIPHMEENNFLIYFYIFSIRCKHC